MSSVRAAGSPRDPGRPQKRLNLNAGPVPLLAQALRDLRDASGYPTYRTLQKYSGISHQRLAEAARGEKLPSWSVIQGYLHGCHAYYQHKHKGQPPLESALDLTTWRRLYHDAGGTLPDEDLIERTGNEPSFNPATADVPAVATTEPTQFLPVRVQPQPIQAYFEWAPSSRHRLNRKLLLIISSALGISLMVGVGVMLDVSPSPRQSSPATRNTPVIDTPTDRNTGISVAAPATACGDAAEDGFLSPATTSFSDIKTVYTLTLDGLSASLIEAVYNGISYQWIEAHPTGSKAGMQLRWSPARNQWYYCTATLEAGNISTLPDLVATIAVPAVVRGRTVIYQACVWHQNPYTERCSKMSVRLQPTNRSS